MRLLLGYVQLTDLISFKINLNIPSFTVSTNGSVQHCHNSNVGIKGPVCQILINWDGGHPDLHFHRVSILQVGNKTQISTFLTNSIFQTLLNQCMVIGSTLMCRVIGNRVYDIHICHTAVEWTGPSKNALCTWMILTHVSVGLMLLSGIAYLIHNWRILQLVLFSPVVLLVGFHYWSVVHLTILILHFIKCNLTNTLWQSFNYNISDFEPLFKQVPPRVSSLAHGPRQEGGGPKLASEGSQGEWEDDLR